MALEVWSEDRFDRGLAISSEYSNLRSGGTLEHFNLVLVDSEGDPVSSINGADLVYSLIPTTPNPLYNPKLQAFSGLSSVNGIYNLTQAVFAAEPGTSVNFTITS